MNMGSYIEYLGNVFTVLKGDEFKLLYFLVMSMASEEADAIEISIGYLMDVMGKSEKSVKKLIDSLVDKGVIFHENGLFGLYLNLSEEDEEDADNQEEKPAKRIGYV